MSERDSPEFELVLEPGRYDREYWRDLWRYRELLFVLAWRDIAARYKQTVIGIAWAVLQPLLTMTVLTIVFGRLAGLPADGAAPYAMMVYAGILPWQLFSNALQSASDSLITNQSLITKVYFPRMIIPAAALIAAVVDFLVALGVLFGLMVIFGAFPDWRIFTLPIFIIVAFAAAFGPGVLIAALNVKYRDFRYVIPFILQFMLYISPVGFSTSIVRERLGEVLWLVYVLNPLVAAIDGFRWAVLAGEAPLDVRGVLLSLFVVGLVAWFGILYFRQVEKTFADVI